MMHNDDASSREEGAIVLSQPVKGSSKGGFVLIEALTTAATNEGVNDHKSWLKLIHKLDELRIVLELPITHEPSLTLDGVIDFFQLLFELHEGLVSIKEKDRAFLDRHQFPSDYEWVSSGDVFG